VVGIKNGAKISPQKNNKKDAFSKREFKKDGENKTKSRTAINIITAKTDHKRTNGDRGLG
jgi:hypothetical protein